MTLSPKSDVRPLKNEVDIWRADLDNPVLKLDALRETMSPDEIQRADRFHFAIHRDRFVAGRGILRALLAQYTDRPAAALEFSYGPRGKPALADSGGLTFNVSHSDAIALYAITCWRRIGVDVERARENVDFDEIAERFFSPVERAVLRTQQPADRSRAFFTCWTRKEAYIKAFGGGLSVPLDRFDVAFAPDEPPRLLEDRGDPDASSTWTIRGIEVGPEVAAAVVVEGPVDVMRVRSWPGQIR